VVHVFGWLPGLRAIRDYRRQWLAKDVTAGIVLTTLLVPQGMAYAELAGLPPITGLYTSIMCLLGYAVFGPSRILVLGPDSSLGPMIAATILPLAGADGDPKRAIALASLLAIMVAAIMILGAVAKVGFIADLISKPTMIGYMNGLALTIIVGQLPKLFGFKVSAEGLIREAAEFVKGVAHGEAVAAAAAVGIVGIALILVLQRWLPKLPAVLIMVVLAIAATTLFDLASHGVSLVGVLPKGFPPLSIPHVRLTDLGLLFGGALGIALVSLADTISTASAFAARSGQEIDGNQEMIGIGVANLAAGLFQGFPVSTSGSRTAVAERSGAKTQLTGVTGAVLITVMIAGFPGLFRNLPNPALAAVVITASLSLADIPGTVRLWRQRKTEFSLSIAAFAGVALLGVLPGIAIAVGLSILNVFGRAWWPYSTELGRVEDLESYHDVHMHPDAQRLPGLVIYRFDAPLFFANAKTFRDEIRRLAAADPPPTWIVIAAEPMTDVDTTASDVLEELDEKLNAEGISLIFAELKDTVRGKIERYGLTRTINPEHFFPTIESAVAAFRQQTGTDWPEQDNLPRSPKAPLSLHCVLASFRHGEGSVMTGKRHVMTVVAALAAIAVTSCSSTSSGSAGAVAASHASALATSSAAAKVKQQATACVQKTGTGALLSSAGRTELVNCLKGLVPADKLTAFKTCVISAAKNDKLYTKAGRTKFTDTSVPNCVNSVA
jgi:high affinity sulfate transporter 1